MSNVKPHSTPATGTGLLASLDYAEGLEIVRIVRPFAVALDSKHLQSTCASCFSGLPEAQIHTEAPSTKLRDCLGCNIVKYCSKVGFSLLCNSGY